MEHKYGEIDQLIDRLKALANGTKFSAEALFITWQAIAGGEGHLAEHTSGQQVCWLVRDLAIVRFGGDARNQLMKMGIERTDDIGTVIQILVDSGLVLADNNDDPIRDTAGVYDFGVEFQLDRQPAYSKTQWQWPLTSMLFLTTVLAIAAAGFANLGMLGSTVAVFAAWTALIGVCCIVLGVADRSNGWLLATVFGIGVLAVSLCAFLAVVLK